MSCTVHGHGSILVFILAAQETRCVNKSGRIFTVIFNIDNYE
jgi:hypothetical protein